MPNPTSSALRAPQGVPMVRIEAGDTLGKIASDAGFTVQDMMAANPNITDANKIFAGQELVMPQAQQPQMAPPIDLPPEVPDMPPEAVQAPPEALEEKGSIRQLLESQSAKNLASTFNPLQKDKTGDDYSPEVIQALKSAAGTALSRDRMNVTYDDYGLGEDSQEIKQQVGRVKGGLTGSDVSSTEGFAGMVDSPAKDAAMSVGGATLVEEEGVIYLTDTYDFDNIGEAQTGGDIYSALRSAMGMASSAGLTNKYKTKIRLGTRDELMSPNVQTVQSGDTLSKLAKANNTSVESLMALNNITDANMIRIGDRLQTA